MESIAPGEYGKGFEMGIAKISTVQRYQCRIPFDDESLWKFLYISCFDGIHTLHPGFHRQFKISAIPRRISKEHDEASTHLTKLTILCKCRCTAYSTRNQGCECRRSIPTVKHDLRCASVGGICEHLGKRETIVPPHFVTCVVLIAKIVLRHPRI